MLRSTATSSTARSTPDCPPERSFMGFHVSFLGPDPALLSATICAYIPWCWRKPAMAINGRRNKPFGPGGGTRRLHQFQGSGNRDQRSGGKREGLIDTGSPI